MVENTLIISDTTKQETIFRQRADLQIFSLESNSIANLLLEDRLRSTGSVSPREVGKFKNPTPLG